MATILVACDEEKVGDSVVDTGTPRSFDPVPGLEVALAGVKRTSTLLELNSLETRCEGDSWSLEGEADVVWDTPERVVVAGWDLVENSFWGAWELQSEDGSMWSGTVSAAELGADCSSPGGVNFVGIPMLGDKAGEVRGGGVLGSVYWCMVWPWNGETELQLVDDDDAWEEVRWRAVNIYEASEIAQGELVRHEKYKISWEATVQDPDWTMEPLWGLWALIDGEADATCAM